MKLKNLFLALRLPFVAASILPFICGSLIFKKSFHFVSFILGILTVAFTHLSANLINDYADSRSGIDWQDTNYYKFFGGSKLIQRGVFSESFYLRLAVIFAISAGFLVLFLAVILSSLSIFGFFFAIIFLAWSYSQKPLQLSYRKFGELVIFMLFGPILVMGGYFIQSKTFPTLEGFMLSLPFAFLVTAILFANEVPDYPQDLKKDKRNWVSLVGLKRSFVLYDILVFLAFFSLALNIVMKYLSPVSLFALPLIFLAFKACDILRLHYGDKNKLTESSGLTITLHTLVSSVLILDLWIRKRS